MSQCLWESWTLDRDRRHTDVVPFALFYREEKKIFIYKHRFFLSSLNLSCLLLSHVFFLFFFSFSSLTNNSPNIPHLEEKKGFKLMLFFFHSQWNVELYHTSTTSRVWGIFVSNPESCCHLLQLQPQTYTSRPDSVPKSSTYSNIGHIQILTAEFLICCMFLYIVHKAAKQTVIIIRQWQLFLSF